MAYSPSLSDIPASQAPQPATSGTYTPSLADIQQSLPINDTGNPTFNKIVAPISGIGQEGINTIRAFGLLGAKLFNNVANIGNAKKAKQINDQLNQWASTGTGPTMIDQLANSPTHAETVAQTQEPGLYSVGQAVGSVGTSMGALAPLTAPISALAGAGMDAIAPTISKSPIMGPLAKTVLQNTMYGAALDPENPVRGAVEGGEQGLAWGVPLAGANHFLGRGGDIVNYQMGNIAKTANDPYAEEAMLRTQAQLKNGGPLYSKYQTAVPMTNAINAKVMEASPLNPSGSSAIETVANLQKANYDNIFSEYENQKAPLIAAKDKFNPSNYLDARSQYPEDSTVKLPVMKSAIKNGSATIDDMWTQRQMLDRTINNVRYNGDANQKQSLDDLIQMRNALTGDIQNSAKSIGLEDNFNTSNSIYHDQLMPFQALTDNGKLTSPSDVRNAMTTLNQVFTKAAVRGRPDFEQINDITKTLGPGGKDLVGQAMLEYVVKQSQDAKGNINAATLNKSIRKMEDSGIVNTSWGQGTRDALNGIQKILEGSPEINNTGMMPKTNETTITNFPMKFLQNMVYSRAGVGALRTIGGTGNAAEGMRRDVMNFLTGLATYHAVNSNPK